MAYTVESESQVTAPGLPGAPVLVRVRRLLVLSAIALVLYSMFARAGTGYCPGGVTADGGFLDASGDPVDVAPSCINLTLKPSFLVYVAVAVIVLWTISAVIRKARDERAAVRMLDRAALIVGATVAVSTVISLVWFTMIPVTEWDGTGTFFFPFPFGVVDVVITPMNG